MGSVFFFFPILQLLFRRFFFDRLLLSPVFLPVRPLFILVPGLGFSKFVARHACRDFSCDLSGSALLPFESDSEGLVSLPGFVVPRESWFSCDLYGLPGRLARLIPRIGCFFLCSRTGKYRGFPATWAGRLDALPCETDFLGRVYLPEFMATSGWHPRPFGLGQWLERVPGAA